MSYRRVDQGVDANGKAWSIGTLDGEVIIDINLNVPAYYAFDGKARDRFIKAWAEAERQAEAHPQ